MVSSHGQMFRLRGSDETVRQEQLLFQWGKKMDEAARGYRRAATYQQPKHAAQAARSSIFRARTSPELRLHRMKSPTE